MSKGKWNWHNRAQAGGGYFVDETSELAAYSR